MKKIFQILTLSASAFVFVAAPNATVFAQDAPAMSQADQDRKAALYETFKINRKGDPNDAKKNVEMRKAAFDAATEFVQKFTGAEEAPVANVMKKYIDEYPKITAELLAREQDKALTDRIEKEYAAKNWGAYFAGVKEYLAKRPDEVSSILYIVLIGNDVSFGNTEKKIPANPAYDNETISLAKDAIRRISADTKTTEWKPFNDKNHALAYMNYVVGNIMFKQNGMEKDAAPYFYKAVQFQSPIKTDHTVYSNIGYSYTQEYSKAAADYKAKCVDVTCPEADAQKAEAQIRGIADRTLDAYARAYSAAKAKNAASPKLTETAQKAYKARFNSDAGFDAYVNGLSNKPLPDPATPIAPIEAAPTTAPGTTTGSTATTTTMTETAKPTTDAANRPRTTGTNGATTTVTTKPGTTVVKPAATTTTTKPAATKPATKPAPKKPAANRS